MNPRILAIGTALPTTRIAQGAAAEVAATLAHADERGARSLRALYRRSGVDQRGAVVIDDAGRPWFFRPGENGDPDGPSTGARLEVFEPAANTLAEAAARDAIAVAGVRPSAITHLITVSCTGFAAPGVDHAIITRLGLESTVQRTNVGFMGCHAAINALRVAGAIAQAEPSAVVLVCCVELCSLHFQYAARREGQAVANALFADGAGAVVMSADPAHAPDAPTPTLRATASRLFPNSSDAMSWRIGDRGFEMTLSPRVPGLLQTHVPEWIDGWLASLSLTRADIGGWAIHPGGPRIVAAVREALELPPECCAHSTGVLADHGNMSSPTILFILKRLQDARVPRPWLAMAFGPGLAGEAALIL